MTLRPRYLIAAAALFLVEIAIAMGYPPIDFVRKSLGDVLVIILVYCALRGVMNWPITTTAVVSFLAGVLAETLQYFHAADRLGLTPDSVGYIMLGNTFSWNDLAMYLIGGVVSWVVDRCVTVQH